MKKLISILTLCLVTGLSMTSPVAASTVPSGTQTSDNINIVQNGLSEAYLCLNQEALLYNGVYLNASCMKLQPKCNSTQVNAYILQQVNGYNAFCQNSEQQNLTADADATTVTNATTSTQSTVAASLITGTKAATSIQATTCPKTGAQASLNPKSSTKEVVYPKTTNQSSTSPKTSTQTITQTAQCPQTNTGTKETQGTETTTSTQAPTSAANTVNTSNNSNSTASFKDFQKKVIDLVNSERAKAGLNALTENSALDNVATLKSEDMVNLNYFSHTSPTYGSPFQMLTQFNIKYTAAGENIAYGQPTPEDVMTGWMNSAGHRANILNTNYTQIGVGVAQKSNGQYVWTQEFSRP